MRMTKPTCLLKPGITGNEMSSLSCYPSVGSGNLRAGRSPTVGRSMLVLSLLALGATVAFGQGDVNRTIIDNEFAQYYGYAPDPTAVGVEMLHPHDTFFTSMTA